MPESTLWVEKYRPKDFSQFIFNGKPFKLAVAKFIKENTLPHLLLSGAAGTGKTTAAKILLDLIAADPSDVLTINASDKNSVDVIRDEIMSFIGVLGVGDVKYVHLEEADYLSQNAQAILRGAMEDYEQFARFILTCNYQHKIIAPVKSRCQQFTFTKLDHDAIKAYVTSILEQENVTYTDELVDSYIRVVGSDVRKVVNTLQQNTYNNKLKAANAESTSDYKFEMLDLLGTDNWQRLRELACTQVQSDEWEDVYRFLYENLNQSKKFKDTAKWETGIMLIAEYLYKHTAVADPEINAAALFISLAGV